MMSAPPPGANGTTSLTGWVGQLCADARPTSVSPTAAAIANVTRRFIFSSLSAAPSAQLPLSRP